MSWQSITSVSKQHAVIFNKHLPRSRPGRLCPHFDFITHVHEVMQKTTWKIERVQHQGMLAGFWASVLMFLIPGASDEPLHTLQGTENNPEACLPHAACGIFTSGPWRHNYAQHGEQQLVKAKEPEGRLGCYTYRFPRPQICGSVGGVQHPHCSQRSCEPDAGDPGSSQKTAGRVVVWLVFLNRGGPAFDESKLFSS